RAQSGAQSARSSAHDSCALILCPMLRALNGIPPALALFGYSAPVSSRLKSRIIPALRPYLLRALPEANRQPRKISRAHRSRFRYRWSQDRNPKQISLKLHEHIVNGRSTIDAQLSKLAARFRIHRVDHIGNLKRNTLQRGMRNVSRLRTATQSNQQPTGVRVPVRRSQADKRRHKNNAIG